MSDANLFPSSSERDVFWRRNKRRSSRRRRRRYPLEVLGCLWKHLKSMLVACSLFQTVAAQNLGRPRVSPEILASPWNRRKSFTSFNKLCYCDFLMSWGCVRRGKMIANLSLGSHGLRLKHELEVLRRVAQLELGQTRWAASAWQAHDISNMTSTHTLLPTTTLAVNLSKGNTP